MKRIVDKSQDDASQKSKKKRKSNLARNTSIGKTSFNDSVMIEGLSQGNLTQSNMNDS
jgi:hypothetical protein